MAPDTLFSTENDRGLASIGFSGQHDKWGVQEAIDRFDTPWRREPIWHVQTRQITAFWTAQRHLLSRLRTTIATERLRLSGGGTVVRRKSPGGSYRTYVNPKTNATKSSDSRRSAPGGGSATAAAQRAERADVCHAFYNMEKRIDLVVYPLPASPAVLYSRAETAK